MSGIRTEKDADPKLRAGITGAVAAIAETGSLLITSGTGKPLSASLLPEIHIVILRPSEILWSLEDALRAKDISRSSSAVLITGPSRTADIEMTLTIGVHGPKQLRVYIVD